MRKEEALQHARALAERSDIAMLGTIDTENHPNIRPMIKMRTKKGGCFAQIGF